MPFDDFYKTADLYREQSRVKIVLCSFAAAFFLIVGYLVFTDLQMKKKERESEKARIADIEKRCDGLPMPEYTAFIGKDEPISYENGTVITYRYKSNRTWADLLPELSFLLFKNDWEHRGSAMSFYKNGQTISIKQTAPGTNTFEIDCFQEKISFVIFH